MTDAEAVNVVLTFVDQDGREWLAGALMTPLQISGGVERCAMAEMPDREFALTGFTGVQR